MPEQETISSAATKVTEYKPAQRQFCFTILFLLMMLPFFIRIHPGLQTVLYSTTCVFLGCICSIEFDKPGNRVNQFEEKMNWTDTLSFPIYASGALVSLYFLYSVLPKELLNALFRINFCVLGFSIIFPFLVSKMNVLFPIVPNKSFGKFKKSVAGMNIDLDLSTHTLISGAITLLIVLLYFFTGHWSLNNILAISFTVGGITLLRIPNFKYALTLLWLLFFYDIYWVFKTDVMVTVAKSFDAPIKIYFPIDPSFKKFSLLGLGDMVIPGICIAVILKFELDAKIQERKTSKKDETALSLDEVNSWPTPMFHLTMGFYFFSIVVTLVGMHLMKHAQPALLYIVPAITLAFASVAYIHKCGKQMFNYEDDLVGVDAVKGAEKQGKDLKEKEVVNNKQEDKKLVDNEDK